MTVPSLVRRLRVLLSLSLVGAAAAGGAQAASAQNAPSATERPRFLVVSIGRGAPVEADAASIPVLIRRLTLDVNNEPLQAVLQSIGAQTGIDLVYASDNLPANRRVTLRVANITVAAALTEVLLGTGFDVLVATGKRLTLVPRKAARAPGALIGKVTDAKTGEPISGADVAVEGSRGRAASGERGFYRIADVEAGTYTVTVRRLGYAKQSRSITIVAATEATADFAMQPVATQLNELVSTATGEHRLLELGHVVGRIDADSIVRESPISNVTDLLTARIPGMIVTPQQGSVGGEVSIQIRTENSIRLATDPIVIVDGVRYTSNPRGVPINPVYFGRLNVGGPFDNEATSRLNDLNPNDIETVEVVKGPSATALYGTDASNGVIVINTKRGKTGRPAWNTYGRASMTEIPQHDYPDIYWGWGDSVTSCNLRNVARGRCTQDSVTVLPNPLNDPSLTIFRNKPTWEYGANVSGGSKDLHYYVSGDLEDAKGPVGIPRALADRIMERRGLSELPSELTDPNGLHKFNARSSLDAAVGERSLLRVSAGYTQSDTRTLSSGATYANTAYRDPANSYDPSSDPENAFAESSTERLSRFFGNGGLELYPLPWLLARASVGVDLSSTNRYSLVRPGDAPSRRPNGEVGDDRIRQTATTADVGLTANLRRSRFSFRTSVGAQYTRTLFDQLTTQGSGLPPGGSTIGEASSIQTYQTYNETVTLGTYLEQAIGLNDRLYVTGALRLDGATGFGRDYNVATYPKVGVSWILSDEPIFARLPVVEELRVRYSFGASGQQPLSSWQQPSYYARQVVAEGVQNGAVSIEGIGNPQLRPERVREHEFGVDAAAFSGRAHLGLTWNYRKTLDQLVTLTLPLGFESIFTNIGRLDGHGFELELGGRPIDQPNFTWNLNYSYALHRNKVLDLGGANPQLSTTGGYAEGYSTGSRFALPLLGYADANGNNIIEPTEIQFGAERQFIGLSTPPKSQTLSTSFGLWQRIRISALLERQTGFTQIDRFNINQCANRVCRAAVDPTTPLSVQADAMAFNARSTQYALPTPGDFTRLREVGVSVDLPTGLARALRVARTTFSVTARNLALWTDFAGPDPEGNNHVFVQNIPQSRAWAFRLDVGF